GAPMDEDVDRNHQRTYARYPLTLVKGEGIRVWDSEGKEYLDFMAGIAVSTIGHCNRELGDAIMRQFSQLDHVSNFFANEPQMRLAKWLVEHSPCDRAFFCNSGAEANEGACKLARKYAHAVLKIEEPVILTALNSFHGRTFGMIAATGQEKVRKGFAPLAP